MDRVMPRAKQLDFLNWEFGVFFHFGIRSFFKGHVDWDDRPMPVSAFDPAELDCGQWIREAKAAGATYAILVTKHHDGFANWPSAYSDYSVVQSPWKNGKGDVVKCFTDACRAYGVKVGLYYSPAQWGGSVDYANEKDYDDYFISQVSELLTNYGKIDYLWFDGCGSDKHEYDRARIVKAIRTLQPDILIFDMWDPDTHWVGNEDGYADMDNSCYTAGNRSPGQEGVFLPAECDAMIRDTWFDCADNEDRIKTTEELVGMYEMSVGRGSNFLLNIGPNSRGLLNQPDVDRLRAFGQALRERYGERIGGFGAIARESDTSWTIATEGYGAEWGNAAPAYLADRLVLSEDMTEGGHVVSFSVWADLPRYHNKKICLYRGGTIGHKAICVFPTMKTGCLTVEVVTDGGEARITDMAAYYTKKGYKK